MQENNEAMDGLGGCFSFFEEKDEEYVDDADVATSSNGHPSALDREDSTLIPGEALIGLKTPGVQHDISSIGSIDDNNIDSIAGS